MRPTFTLRQLEIFLAVARAGHVTRGAEALHLSQSATSAALAEIEQRLGDASPAGALLVREGRGVRLTDRGRRLAEQAERLLASAAELPALLGDATGPLAGELRLAASQTVGRDILAPALARFVARHPGVTARCRVAGTPEAIATLLADDADVAYVEGERAVAGPGLVARLWRRDALAIVTTAARAAALPLLTPEALSELPWVLREAGSGTRERFDAALRDAGLPPARPRLVLNDTEAVRQALRTGFGWSCLPRAGLGGPGDGLVPVPAPFLDLRRRLWRVVRPDAIDKRSMLAFEAFLDGPDPDETSGPAAPEP